jgi:glucosamine--fructose-6-phosphate aminotransferase (isomerizing)
MTAFLMDEHIAAQPATVERLLDEAAAVPAIDPERPVVFTGIGTSLHACRVAASWVRLLTGGAARPTALDAHDLALSERLRPQDQVVVVSHRGTKACPNDVLAAAAQVGATTVAVTGQGPAEPSADVVVRTCAQERAGTHAESYTAALAVLAKLVCAMLGDGADELAAALDDVPAAMRRTLDMPLASAAVTAVAHAPGEPVLLTGTGLDAITVDEAALKLKEGTYRWAEGMHTEFALHGTPAVFRASMTAFLVRPAGADGGRTDALAGVLRTIGAPVFRVGDDTADDLGFAAVHPLARPFVAILPFHRLVSAVAARVGSNPDLTHLEDEPWASAIKSVTL